jgi:hypothetical protein
MPVLALWVGDLPVLREWSDAFRESAVLIEARLLREASVWWG